MSGNGFLPKHVGSRALPAMGEAWNQSGTTRFPRKKTRRAKALQDILLRYWGGWTRTTNFLVNSQALCQLSDAPSTASDPPAAIRVRRIESTDEERRKESYGGSPLGGGPDHHADFAAFIK